MTFNKIIFLQPLVNLLLSIIHFPVVNSRSLNDIRIGEHLTDCRNGTAEAISTMSGEEHNVLALKIITFKKGVDGHRHVVPPQGIPYKDDIIVGEVLHLRLQFRLQVVGVFHLGLVKQGFWFGRIAPLSLYPEQISIEFLAQNICHMLCVSIEQAIPYYITGS